MMSTRRQQQIDKALACYSPKRKSDQVPIVVEQGNFEPDVNWFAGLLEGEGSFLPGSPSKPNKPHILATTTDEDVAQRLSVFFGTRYIPVRNYQKQTDGTTWKQPYRALVAGKRAVDLMRQLHPLMGSRRQEQINRALASYTPHKCRSNAAPLTKEQVLDIYYRAQASDSPTLLSLEYGVKPTTVKDIRRGRSWAWLTQPASEAQPEIE